jgi:hypothetical protein
MNDPGIRTMILFALTLAIAAGELVKVQDDESQWVMAGKNYSATRYSRLADIDAKNVKGLKVASTFSTGFTKSDETAPLVVPIGVANTTDNMILDMPSRTSASGFGHLSCKGGKPSDDTIKSLPEKFPPGPKK